MRISIKNTFIVGLLVGALGLVYSSHVQAAPTLMNFQGRLRTSDGNNVADGLYNIKFAIYSATSGGTALWSETRQTTTRVQVTGGLFSTQLGMATALPASVFNTDTLYFETTMATPATATCSTLNCASWETPMTPRHRLASSAYAMNSETLDGKDSTEFASASGSNSYIQNTTSPQSASFNVTGKGTIGGAANQVQLTIKAGVAQYVTTPHLILQNGSSEEDARLVASGSSVAFGWESLSNSTGTHNTAIGQATLRLNTTGTYNTALGSEALRLNTTGNDNTAIGEAALWVNTTGSRNMSLGTDSLSSNTTGSDNVAIGFNALNNTNASGNVGIGTLSLSRNISGNNNLAIGYSSGGSDAYGEFKTGTNLQNATAIGAYAQVQSSNSLVLGSVDLETKVGIGTTKPSGIFSVNPIADQTGTASQSGNTITGVGTNWTSSHNDMQFIFADGTDAIITNVVDATHLEVDISRTVANQYYRIHRPAFNVADNGTVMIGTFFDQNNAQLSVQGSVWVGQSVQAKGFESSGYRTTSTGPDGTGPWTKLATCSLEVIYSDCRTTADVITIADSGSIDRTSVDIRVKQQEALGQAPVVMIRLNDTIGLNPSQFKTITAVNTTSETRVELWGRVMYPWQVWSVGPKLNSGTRPFTWHSEQPLVASLPAGTQTSATHADETVGNLMVRPATNNPYTLNVKNIWGDTVFNVDTENDSVTVGAGTLATTNNSKSLGVNFVGGAANVEGAGVRVDYTPGTTTDGKWSGIRVVANTTGAVSGVESYGIKLEGPGTPGAGTEVGLKIAGGFDIGVDIASGSLQMAAVPSEPTAPATGNMKIYAKDIAGRMMLKSVGPSGLDVPYQPALFANNVAMLLPSTTTGVTTFGMPNTAVGTISTPAITAGSLISSMRRMTVTSAATAPSASDLRSQAPLVWRGNAAGLGGFFYASRFSVGSTTANQQLFSGLSSNTGAFATSGAPSSFTNTIGVGWDSADTTLQIMSNDASGSGTKVNLGSNFPSNSASAYYELILFAAANGSSVGYRVQRLDTGQTASGTISTDLPASNLMLTHHQYMNNGGTAATVVLNVNRVYIESDF